MNQSYLASSLTPTPTPPTPPHQVPLPSPLSTRTRLTASVIPLDYNYQTMAPSAEPAATHTLRPEVDVETQYSSLFGDPVPPPPPADFYAMHYIHPFRTTSVEPSSPEQEDVFGRTVTLPAAARRAPNRLFSDVPYSSSLCRRLPTHDSIHTGFNVLPTPMPRLEPPDIQILPNTNSSSSSSSEQRDSPNFALLTAKDIEQKTAQYDANDLGTDVIELMETITASDASGRREYSEATRRVTNFSEDFKSHVGSLSNNNQCGIDASGVLATTASFTRQPSNESYSSSEWFRPVNHTFPEFSKIPRLRPSSKNVMSIKRVEMPTEHSPVAKMIHDSNGSSSGEERLMNTTQTLDQPTVPLEILKNAPERPPDPSPNCLREMETNMLLDQELERLRRKSSTSDSLGPNYPKQRPTAPPPIPPAPPVIEEINELATLVTVPISRDMSPVVIRDSVAMGGDFRVDHLRLHKKASFSIISDRSTPQSSRPQSPTSHTARLQTATQKDHNATSLSFAKPIAKPRHHLQRKSLSSTQLKLPQLTLHQMTSDDSPRPSVQFNMTGRYSPSKTPQKSILQQRVSLSSSQDTLPPQAALHTAGQRRRLSSLPPSALTYGPKMKSCETLPLIQDTYRTAIPRLNRSTQDLRPESAIIPPGTLPRPLKPNPNPTRRQRGLLRIFNGAEAIARRPLHSNWASMDDLTSELQRRPSLIPLGLSPKRRRSSSTSPERRSSTQTISDRRSSNLSTVTTSDLSFRRTSLTPQPQRRKSIVPTNSIGANKRRKSIVVPNTNQSSVGNRTPRTRIAKATTLSPIIGTPNKDGSTPQSPSQVAEQSLAASETHSDETSRRGSLSKIPVRSRADSRPESRNSRSSSPLKDLSTQLLSELASGPTSRSPSRTTVRYDSQPASRVTSRGASRSTSRASTRAISRGPSRTSSRAGSRMDQAKELANSRSNSRTSVHSTTRTGSVTPTNGRHVITTHRRRKSISLSPQSNRRSIGDRRRSVSAASQAPPDTSRGRGQNAKKHLERTSSRSRIPRRTSSEGLGESMSPTNKASNKVARNASERQAKTTSSPAHRRLVGERRSKEPASAKKAPSSVRKPDSSVKRTPSSVGKQVTSTKKQPSNTQSSGINLKRETSNLKKGLPVQSLNRETSQVSVKGDTAKQSVKREASQISLKAGESSQQMKREASQMSIKKVGVAATVTTGKSGIQRTSSTKSIAGKATDAKSATKEKETNKTKNAGSEKEGAKSSSSSGSSAKVGRHSASATPTKGTKTTGGINRQPSKMTLIRMGSRMSLLGKKRSDTASKLTSKISEETAADVKDSAGSSTEAYAGKGTALKTHKAGEDNISLPSSILEKSQKTLENGQKTATNAIDEIHKTTNENLTDLRSMESDIGRTGSESATSPTSSAATVIENRAGKKGGAGESISRLGTADDPATGNATKGANNSDGAQKSPLPPGQPIEATVSVVNGSADAAAVLPQPNVEAGERNYEFGLNEKSVASGAAVDAAAASSNAATADNSSVDAINVPDSVGSGEEAFKTDAKRRSPDGQGGSSAGSGNNTGSREFLKTNDDDDVAGATAKKSRGCCRCCARFCMPCRRSRCSRCCRRNKSRPLHDEAEEPVLSATSSATTTNLEVIDETKAKTKKEKGKSKSCWQKLMCCKRCTKRSTAVDEMPAMEAMAAQQMASIREEEAQAAAAPPPVLTAPPKQSKFGLCLSKVFCCRAVNKVDTTTGDETEVKKCCFCIPCRRKRSATTAPLDTASAAGSTAWQDPERGIVSTDASVLEGGSEALPKEGCCKRFWGKLLCCRHKPVPRPSDSRRASMKVPPPPAEDTRRKLHVDLVEYNSKMKGAIPVLPLYLAWFCAICNTLFPGLGTLLSGLFCICIGIPRFSQFDSAKARFGSFIINTIVAVAQLFCVLFCFVGWGWSIWWGTIMLRCARKLSKIKKVERLEMEDERRQAEMAATAAAATARAPAAVVTTEPEAAKA